MGSGLLFQIIVGGDKIIFTKSILSPVHENRGWGSGLHFQIIVGGDKIFLTKYILSPGYKNQVKIILSPPTIIWMWRPDPHPLFSWTGDKIDLVKIYLVSTLNNLELETRSPVQKIPDGDLVLGIWSPKDIETRNYDMQKSSQIISKVVNLLGKHLQNEKFKWSFETLELK